MIAVYLRTYPEGSQLWDLAIGPGAEWYYSGSLSLDKAAVVPSELAGLSLPWLVVGVRNAQGRVFAEKALETAFLKDNVVYGFYWESEALAAEGSVVVDMVARLLLPSLAVMMLGVISSREIVKR